MAVVRQATISENAMSERSGMEGNPPIASWPSLQDVLFPQAARFSGIIPQ